MHISEGIISSPYILLGGTAISIVGIAVGLRKMDFDEVPKVAILTSAFFICSLIHVPIGPASAHLVLNGLLGLLLGWACFPAILVALLMQALFFQYGGITVLGINTLNMALPAVIASYIGKYLIGRSRYYNAAGAFIAGAGAVLGAGVMLALFLVISGQEFLPVAKMIVLAHLPVMIIEGVICAVILNFILKVRPEML
mgnify:FL=1